MNFARLSINLPADNCCCLSLICCICTASQNVPLRCVCCVVCLLCLLRRASDMPSPALNGARRQSGGPPAKRSLFFCPKGALLDKKLPQPQHSARVLRPCCAGRNG